MTLLQLEQFIKDNIQQPTKAAIIIDAVRKYSSASNNGKPLVSGSLPLVDILDLLNKAHEALAKSEISQDEYSPISWTLVDAKKRIGVLLSGNDR